MVVCHQACALLDVSRRDSAVATPGGWSKQHGSHHHVGVYPIVTNKKYHIVNYIYRGTWLGKLFRLSEKGPLSGAAFDSVRAKLLRAAFTTLQEAVLRASGEVVAVPSALHAGLRGEAPGLELRSREEVASFG